jgi:hypothetical protein
MGTIRFGLLVVLNMALCVPVWGWWGKGHAILTKAVMQTLPEEIPIFFRAGWPFAAHGVYDPDLFKNNATPQLDNAEFPEHFFDLELLEGHSAPLTRYEFIKLCAEVGVEPRKVGFVPYATAEWTQRLTVAFAEHRKWPDNPMIQSKCLVYAGILAHYAQDMCQPLHLTIHFDGRVGADGQKVHKGIHEQVDALIEKLKFKAEELAWDIEPAPIEDLMGEILYRVDQGNARVEQVYELAEALKGPLYPDEVWQFAQARSRDAIGFTASLYLTAWRDSEEIQLPDWLKR